MGNRLFNGKILAAIAAVLFTAACSTVPDDTASGTSGGAATTPTTTTTTTAPAPAPAPAARAETVGPAAGSIEDFVLNVGDRVFFGFDKYNLSPEARKTLERQAAWLKTYPSKTVTIEGHTDERGTREYNLALGERRANAAKSYLIALGIDPARISTISYGKERPVALGSNEAAWAQNRRAVTRIN